MSAIVEIDTDILPNAGESLELGHLDCEGGGMISPAEVDRLAELEAVVERGKMTFVEVGNALLEIRDLRLYRGAHGTFDSYCRERWGFSRSRGYRLIRAAELAGMSPVGDIQNERQARALLESGRQAARPLGWPERNYWRSKDEIVALCDELKAIEQQITPFGDGIGDIQQDMPLFRLLERRILVADRLVQTCEFARRCAIQVGREL